MFRPIKTMMAAGLSAALIAGASLTAPAAANAGEAVRADGSFDVAQNWNGPHGPDWRRHGWRGPGYGRPGYGPGGWHRPPPPRYGYHPGWRGPGYYVRPGYPGTYYYNNYNAALAAGVFGLATGAIIAGAAANNQRAATSDYIAYCSQRYRSFNPATGTYTGYDGLQHRCVMQ